MDKSIWLDGACYPEPERIALCNYHSGGGVKTPVESVTISGTAQVGQTLTANVTPAGATVTYQWKQADSAAGSYSDISGATGKTRKLSASEQGKYIKVEVTGTGNYSGTKLSEATSSAVAAE